MASHTDVDVKTQRLLPASAASYRAIDMRGPADPAEAGNRRNVSMIRKVRCLAGRVDHARPDREHGGGDVERSFRRNADSSRRPANTATASGKVAGLGQVEVITVTVTGDAACVNPGSKKPPGG